jgi:radical SAM-linked protein
MPKYLLTFEKGESVRWLGHLDILRTFERAIRRAGLPIAFSNGFNPRERLAFASALGTGVTGGAEPAVLELTAPLPADAIGARLNDALPPGIRIRTCLEIPDAHSRDLLNAFDRAEYAVVCTCPPETAPADIEAALGALLSRTEISITREREGRAKTVDIRPYLFQLTRRPENAANGRLTLDMIVALGESGSAKPPEVIAALSAHLPGLTLRRAHRVRLIEKND